MHNSSAVAATEDTGGGLLDLAPVPFHVLLAEQDTKATTVLDSVLRRLFDPDRDKLTVSAFGSAL